MKGSEGGLLLFYYCNFIVPNLDFGHLFVASWK